MEPLIPDLAPTWRSVRKLEDAILETLDNAVYALLEDQDIECPDVETPEGEAALEELATRLLNLALKGEHP